MKQMWEIKQKTQGTLDLYIYGDVKADGYDWWREEVIRSETSANTLRDELASHPEVSQINIYINSQGGSVIEGTAIYNQLKRHPAHKTVYVDGFACSIASVIAMAGDEVVMPRNTMMMLHNMWMVVQGNAAELRKAADDLDKMNEAGRAAYLQKAGDKLTPERIAQMEDEETWLTAKECVEYGLADRFTEQDAELSDAAEVLKKANLDLEQRIRVQKSLAAQLRALTNPPQEEKPVPEQKTNPILKLFEGS